MSLKGTQTEKNLLTAFAGESQAHTRYLYYAKKAKKDGYEQISAIFEETSFQELQHAKEMFKYLEGGDVEITAAFPAGVIGDTLDNLKAAAAGEHHETTSMYPEYADTAEKEGFKEIAGLLRRIAVAEKRHEDRYMKLIANIETEEVFKKPAPQRWICRKCGYVHEGPGAVKVCPLCKHPQGYFEIDPLNY